MTTQPRVPPAPPLPEGILPRPPDARPKHPAGLEDVLNQYDTVALVLQGGGALGAYQGGVFQALDEAGICPRWFSGVSIGAINGAIMAGNRPGDRLDRLHDFWTTLTRRHVWPFPPEGDLMRGWHNMASAAMTMNLGLPGFFAPRRTNPWLAMRGAAGATSFYDTTALRATLDRLVNWDLLNDRDHRLSVGTVNVETGNYRYFDSAEERLGPEHIMASGALPPAFAPVRIENDHYWDGGIVSNTPLQYLLEHDGLRDTLVFQVDLFNARGPLPRDMGGVLDRHKEIMYSSRTRHNTDVFRRMHNLRLWLHEALDKLPQDQWTARDHAFMQAMTDIAQVNIIHLVYQKKIYEGHQQDYEFSGSSMREHWQAGLDDTRRTLAHRHWLDIPSERIGVSVSDVHHDDPT
ncbi:MAG: patatin-like phospholipase family protein [Gemmobacter sp.]